MKTIIFNMIVGVFLLIHGNNGYAENPSEISIPAGINKTTYCPSNGDKFGHVMVIIDTTGGFEQPQVDFIESEVFSEQFYKKHQPFTKFSYLLINNNAPQSQKFIVSKCRTKTSTKTNFPSDIHTSDESKMYVTGFWKKFTKDMNSAFDNIFSNKDMQGGARGSLIYETITTVLTSPKFDFTSSTKNRKLIIVSDMMQNSERISFYRFCKKSIFNTKPNECPKFLDLLTKPSIEDYFESTSAKNEKVDINLIYINHSYQTERTLDQSLAQLWLDYFSHMGFKNVSIKRQLDF